MFSDLMDLLLLVSQIVGILFMVWAAVCVLLLMGGSVILFDDWRIKKRNARHANFNKKTGEINEDSEFFKGLLPSYPLGDYAVADVKMTNDLWHLRENSMSRNEYLDQESIEFRPARESPTMVHAPVDPEMTAVYEAVVATTPPEGVIFIGGVAMPTPENIPLEIEESDEAETPAAQPH